MDQLWIPIVIIVLMLAGPLANSYYSMRTGRASLTREVLVRAWMVFVLFGTFALVTRNLSPAIGLGVFLVILLAGYAKMTFPLKQKMYEDAHRKYLERKKKSEK